MQQSNPNNRLPVLDTVATGVADVVRHLPQLARLYFFPWLLGTSLCVAVDALWRQQSGDGTAPALVWDIVWSPFAAGALVAMIRHLNGQHQSARDVGTYVNATTATVTIVVLALNIAAGTLDLMQSSVYDSISNALHDPNEFAQQSNWRERSVQLKRWNYLIFSLRGLLGGTVALSLLGLIPIAIARGRIDFRENIRLVTRQPATLFAIVMFAGIVIHLLEFGFQWTAWQLGLDSPDYQLIGWRQDMIRNVLYFAALFPSALFDISLEASLLTIVWRNWLQGRSDRSASQ